MSAPRSPRPCDHCGEVVAPLGFGPPPALAIAVARPLQVCTAPACTAWALARRVALIAAHDPLAPTRPARSAPLRPDPAQGTLL